MDDDPVPPGNETVGFRMRFVYTRSCSRSQGLYCTFTVIQVRIMSCFENFAAAISVQVSDLLGQDYQVLST